MFFFLLVKKSEGDTVYLRSDSDFAPESHCTRALWDATMCIPTIYLVYIMRFAVSLLLLVYIDITYNQYFFFFFK